MPGGKIDTDEEIEAGLKREVNEEANINIEIMSSLVHVENELIHEGIYSGALYVALFYYAQKVDGDLKLSHEHSESVWCEINQTLTYDLTPETRRAIAALAYHYIN